MNNYSKARNFVEVLVQREKSKPISSTSQLHNLQLATSQLKLAALLVWVAKEANIVEVQILRSLLPSLTLIGQASMDEYVDHAFVSSSECNGSQSDASPHS